MYLFHPIIPAHSSAPLGPYSPGMDTGDFLFFSGQIATAPDGSFRNESLETELTQIFENIEALFQASQINKAHVVKVTMFLQDMDDFSFINGKYADFFGIYKPARSTIQVARLPLNARVEIEIIAKR